jgi:DNA-binding transcriptional ArsR family regulator
MPQFALSKRKPEELRSTARKARIAHPILDNPEELSQRAQFFQAIGHELRLTILGLLEVEELCFCDIIQALKAPPSTVAHHLSMLEGAGVITRKENGKYTSFVLRKDLITKHHVLQQYSQGSLRSGHRTIVRSTEPDQPSKRLTVGEETFLRRTQTHPSGD